MTKPEITKRLYELLDIIDVKSEDYVKAINKMNPGGHQLKPEDAWIYKIGVIKANIEEILGVKY